MDEFWKVQLDQGRRYGPISGSFDDNSDNSSEENFEAKEHREARPRSVKTYSFPGNVVVDSKSCKSFNCAIDLRLSSLPKLAGSFSPLGADPWYGSALLSSLLLQSCDGCSSSIEPNNRLQDHIARNCAQGHSMRVLELGSGAVGISAFAAVFAILRLRSNLEIQKNRDEVILTDNNRDVLRQLKHNVNVAAKAFGEMTISNSVTATVPIMSVHNLDWSDDRHEIDLAFFQLAMGAELVYTPSTARACFKVVQKLLDCNSNILIVVVQVSDRVGWRDVFLPRLESIGALVITEQIPLEIHDHATNYVDHGGTLNALRDFEVCYISSNKHKHIKGDA